MAIEYPTYLPLPLREDYGFEPVNNINRTDMQSGRARQRIEFENVPDMLNLKWNLTQAESALFSLWARKVVGAGWFSMKLLTPLGFEILDIRFTKRVSGPILRGRFSWDWSATVEVKEMPELDEEWLEFPEYVLDASILDVAINKLWPLNPWQVYIQTTDETLNERWPKA